MSDHETDQEERYFSDADTWARDRLEARRRLLRITGLAAAAATVVAVLEAFALIALAPLKTVVPYTLLVDRQTGYVQAVDPINASRITPDAALTQSFLVQYVTAREGFDIDSVQADYRKVVLMSAEQALSEYLALMQASNPASPLRRYPRSTIIDVRVNSVSSLGDNVSMIRFDTLRRDRGGQQTVTGAWATVVRYRYSNAEMPAEDRYVNPLGFQVVRYRRSAEALPPVAPAVVTVTPTGPAPIPSPPVVAETQPEVEAGSEVEP